MSKKFQIKKLDAMVAKQNSSFKQDDHCVVNMLS